MLIVFNYVMCFMLRFYSVHILLFTLYILVSWDLFLSTFLVSINISIATLSYEQYSMYSTTLRTVLSVYQRQNKRVWSKFQICNIFEGALILRYLSLICSRISSTHDSMFCPNSRVLRVLYICTYLELIFNANMLMIFKQNELWMLHTYFQ